MHYVYRLINQTGETKYVGYTKYPKKRLYQHTKEMPDGTGFRGRFYGEDLSIEVLATFDTKKEALHFEGEMKRYYNFPWTEKGEGRILSANAKHNMSLGGKKGGRNSHKNGSSPAQLAQLAKVRNPQKAADSRPKAKCPYCGLEGLRMNMKRWHFDNCKHKV